MSFRKRWRVAQALSGEAQKWQSIENEIDDVVTAYVEAEETLEAAATDPGLDADEVADLEDMLAGERKAIGLAKDRLINRLGELAELVAALPLPP